MARTDNLKNYLTDVAEAIREKTNTTDKIKASEFDDKIREISGTSEQWEWALNNVINFGSANPTFFQNNTYLKVIPNYFEDKYLEITNWSNAFSGCTNLTTIGDLNLNVCTNINGAFYNCTNLKTIRVLSVPKVQIFNNLFYNCKTLESIEQFNVSSVTNLNSLFAQSNNLKSVDFVNSTSKVTNFSGLFAGKTVLETVKGLDLSSATNLTSMFASCPNLKNITFVENSIKINFSLGSSSLLSNESIQSLINGLATVETAQNLTIHSDIATKLTNEQKATISSKNWNIVISQGGGDKTELEVTDSNTLIATISGRQFTKTNDGLAIACIVTFGIYTGILLVSEVEEAVAFSALGDNLTSAGSFTYDDKNYYYSSRGYFMAYGSATSNYPNLKDISGTTYTNDNGGSEKASTDLLNYYFNK